MRLEVLGLRTQEVAKFKIQQELALEKPRN